MSNILISKRSIYKILVITVSILIIPFTAMQFSSEVNWLFNDFILAGILILLASYLFELALRHSNTIKQKRAYGFIIAFSFIFLWALIATDKL